eukprot:gene2832-3518_t
MNPSTITTANVVFPLLVPVDSSLNQYYGYIEVLELKDIIDRISSSTSSSSTNTESITKTTRELKIKSLPFDVYSLVLSEIDIIGWDNITKIDKSLSQIEVLLKDNKFRRFKIEIKIPDRYPNQIPKIQHHLPNENLQIPHTNNIYSLPSIIKLLGQSIEEYQDFFDIMDEIDSNTWVLEPEHPKRSSTYRRIALENHCSLCIQVNPTSPRAFPEDCRFLGSDKNIQPLKNNLNANIKQWDVTKGLIENFQSVLDTKFPLRQNTKAEEFVIECGVCYAHRLTDSGSIPDIACNNLKCQKHFHNSCLYEWLKSVPKSYYSFNVLYGTCPYCTDPISVKFQQPTTTTTTTTTTTK